MLMPSQEISLTFCYYLGSLSKVSASSPAVQTISSLYLSVGRSCLVYYLCCSPVSRCTFRILLLHFCGLAQDCPFWSFPEFTQYGLCCILFYIFILLCCKWIKRCFTSTCAYSHKGKIMKSILSDEPCVLILIHIP
jgi:hypothetical protein